LQVLSTRNFCDDSQRAVRVLLEEEDVSTINFVGMISRCA